MSLQYTTSTNIRAKLKRSILYRLSFVFSCYTSNSNCYPAPLNESMKRVLHLFTQREGITLELIVNYCIIWYTLSGFYMLTMKKSAQYLIWLKSPEINGLRSAVSAWRLCMRTSELTVHMFIYNYYKRVWLLSSHPWLLLFFPFQSKWNHLCHILKSLIIILAKERAIFRPVK